MKINLEQVIQTVDGEPRKHLVPKLNELGVPVTDEFGNIKMESKGDLKLKDVLYASVNATYQKDDNPKPEDLYKRGHLARRVRSGGEKHFSNDDITIFKELSAKRYGNEPVLVLQILEIIDPDNKIFKEPEEQK